MFWIALELSIPKIGFNIMLSLTVKKLDAYKFDGVAESDNTAQHANKTVSGSFPLKVLFFQDRSVNSHINDNFPPSRLIRLLLILSRKPALLALIQIYGCPELELLLPLQWCFDFLSLVFILAFLAYAVLCGCLLRLVPILASC